jgi:hypothetical protein
MGGVGVGLGGIKFRNSGNDGQLLVWWPSLSHSTQGGGMCGGHGAVGSFFALLPPAIARGVGSIGVVGVLGVRTGIVMGSPAYGRGTISGGCKYHTGIANTILGSVSVAATCWLSEVTPGLLAGAEPEAHQF